MVVILGALLVLWTMFGQKLTGGDRPVPPTAASTNTFSMSNAVGALAKAESIAAPEQKTPAVAATNAAPIVVEPQLPAKPEQTLTLTNDWLEVVVSSKGAALNSVVIKNYRESVDKKSGPVKLDFTSHRSLAPVQFAGVPPAADFDLKPTSDGRGAELEYRTPSGLIFQRIITLPAGQSYLLAVADALKNTNKEPLTLPAYGMQLGAMSNLPGETQQKGYVYLGVDTLPGGGEKVQYLSGDIGSLFEAKKNPQSLAVPESVESAWPKIGSMDWLATKNKYFAQILMPNDATEGLRLWAQRELGEGETNTTLRAEKLTALKAVGAAVMFPEAHIEADKPVTRTMQLYVGPKLYSALQPLKRNIVDVMEFGFWGPVGKVLLWTMNAIASIWPHNYGLAIMLLTILIRIIFWPLTHKSTQSMKRMQAVQPLMKEIREKFKDNAQKQQQEMMKLYKEHKINPLGGCLPMLIQIPVFIALFVVLRSAIELRFASFLWIKDLSEAENLFPFGYSIPLLGWSAINILPILMAVTMFWQQKLTPSTGDAQQQKIMMFMPVMMLFFFYNFAAGLSLYWTTNQVLMIVQLYWQRKHPTALAKA
ncbi:MAG: membrane protein insertase YidC [Kiritimatiellaeota bacterium]|nr:membrane protein insertase YidC [Kiritimatiellota bacterium]